MKDFSSHAAERQQFHEQWNKGKFGQPAGVPNWETFADDAEMERGVMVAEFHVWLIKTRYEVERHLMASEAHQRSIAPFADAGLEAAKTPRDIPVVVLEFASTALAVMKLKRKLDLCNVYYAQAASDQAETHLNIEPGNEGEVNELWRLFIKERDAEKDKAAK